jgi:hypothetical protein
MSLNGLFVRAKRLYHSLKIVDGLGAVLASGASRVRLLLLLNLVLQLCVEILYLVRPLVLVLLITFIAPIVRCASLLGARAT